MGRRISISQPAQSPVRCLQPHDNLNNVKTAFSKLTYNLRFTTNFATQKVYFKNNDKINNTKKLYGVRRIQKQ